MLLEVLIAFALVVLCAIPLIYPHTAMLKAQYQFVSKLELDHAVNLLYGNVLEKLYLNKLNWTDITQNPMEVTEEMLKEAHFLKPLPYQGTYTFIEDDHRPKKIGPYNLFQFTLVFSFISTALKKESEEIKQKNKIEYRYKVFLVRDLGRTP
jgi:hypothetical protein